MSLPRLRTLRNAKARQNGELLCHYGFLLCLYSFVKAQSKSSVPSTPRTPSINITTVPDPPGAASTVTQSFLSKGKRKNEHPSSPRKASKVQTPNYDADLDEANDAIGNGINEFDFDTPKTEPHHTKRRQRYANAWQELMPTLVHPLMAALHTISPNSANKNIEVQASSCVSTCYRTRSTVKSISFGGV